MKMIWEEHTLERSKIGRKLPQNEPHQSTTYPAHEIMLKGNHSEMIMHPNSTSSTVKSMLRRQNASGFIPATRN